MTKERIEEIIKQVLFNPQISYPPISYRITEVGTAEYSSEYMDIGDFETYLKRLEKQLVYRLTV